MPKDINFYLEKTQQAFDSGIALDVIREQIRNERVEKREKIRLNKRIYKNEKIERISQILFLYSPKHDFFEILLDRFLTDMEKFDFEKTPSVNKTDEHTFKFFDDVKRKQDLLIEKLRCYYDVSLLQHILDLFVVLEENLSNYEIFKGCNKFELLLACLLHDFGKNIKVQEYCGFEKKLLYYPHAYVSSEYLTKVLKEFENIYKSKHNTLDDVYFSCRDLMDRVLLAVKNHHSTEPRKEGSLVDLLIKVDANAREYEWKQYLTN